ncbi:hypothetical protein [Shewanella sp.]|uniref:hypothetical protein n=1 Tax=Shewanella sp. TaxID=50422 RepID=UPI003A96A4BC
MDYAKHLTTQTLLGNANIAPLDAIPLDMRGSPNAHEQTWQQDDWIEWHTVASPLTEADIAAFEQRFAIALPQQFKQYLLACCHLFDEMPTQGFAEMSTLPTPHQMRH